MHLLYPPDVAGWNWGEGWVSSYNILRRTKFTGMAQWVNNGTEEEPKWEPGPPLQRMHTAMKSMNPTTPQEYVMCMCDLYDVDLSEGSKREFADFAREQQAVDALSDPGWFGGTHTEMLKLLTATPEYQML
jgi:hypothetical protein